MDIEQFPSRGLYARCFGNFELFCNGTPVRFARQQTKELLAYLIDRNGAIITAEEAAAVLWEDDNDMAAMKHRLRNLIGDMKNTFSLLGCPEIVIRRRNRIGLSLDGLESDYSRYLNGTARPQEQYRGEYMEQYSWAEVTKGALIFNIK